VTAPLFFGLTRGEAPLIVSIPHAGTDIPPALEARLASPWLGRRDADWHVRELYAFAADLGATVIAANLSRTVIDLNRDPSGVSLYPGQATTGLCPAESFDGEPLWRAGREPDPAETAARRAAFFDPYHQALAAEIARLKARHGAVVLWDAHSIRSRIPRLFEGVLPDLNLGTFGGASCDPSLAAAVEAVCAASSFSHVCNGRFKGGWITRRYGRPAEGVHALQMELACRAYLAEPRGPLSPANWPASFDPVRAAPLAATLRAALAAALEILPALAKDAP
jgi:N-formylglutamate deformylase